MGAHTGAIPSAIGSRQVQLSHTGKVFPLSAENLRRWSLWWRYVRIDRVWLWGLGCFVGMFLNVNPATAIMPAGEDITGPAAGAFQARYMAEHLWHGFWLLALLNGFWIRRCRRAVGSPRRRSSGYLGASTSLPSGFWPLGRCHGYARDQSSAV